MPGKYLPLICFIMPVRNLIPSVFVKDIRELENKFIFLKYICLEFYEDLLMEIWF